MTDDATLEADLRAMFAAREPGPAPVRLVAAFRERAAADRPRPFANLGRLIVAGAATVAIVVVLVLVAARPISPGPGASFAPEPTSPYSIQPGDAVVTGEHLPFFQALGFIVVLAVLLGIAIRTRHKWLGIGATLAALFSILVAVSIGTSDALAFGTGSWGVSPSREALTDAPGMYVAVTGDQPFVLHVTVTNNSRLPLELLGLAPDPNVDIASEQPPPILPRFIGLGSLPDNEVVVEAIRPFRSVVLAPGASTNIAVLGMAGTCAIPSIGPDGQAGYSLDHVSLVYEQLTIVHDEAYELPEPIVITTTGRCP